MTYVLILIATITRFGTIGGAGVAINSVEFNTPQECARAMEWAKDHDVKAACFPKGQNQ